MHVPIESATKVKLIYIFFFSFYKKISVRINLNFFDKIRSGQVSGKLGIKRPRMCLHHSSNFVGSNLLTHTSNLKTRLSSLLFYLITTTTKGRMERERGREKGREIKKREKKKKTKMKKKKKGFPGGAVVENLPADAGNTGSSPGLGRSHMPQSDWTCEPRLLSLRVWSLCSATKGHDSEARAPQ